MQRPGNLVEHGLWLSLVERCVRDAEAVGSNPTSPIPPRATIPFHMKRTLISLALLAAFSPASSLLAYQDQGELPPDLKAVTLYSPPLDYPSKVWRRGIQGKVVVRAFINPKTGLVDEVKILKPSRFVILNELAAKNALQWRFRPGTRGTLEIPYDFSVSGYARQLH